MADTGDKLEKRFQDTFELAECADELIHVLESGKSVVSDITKYVDTMNKVVDKYVKAKEATSATQQTLIENAVQMEKNNVTNQDNLSHLLEMDTPDLVAIKRRITLLKQEVQKRENDCEKLRREHKLVKSSKVQRRLQKAIVNVNFDLSSTEQNLRGYVKGGGDTIKTFEVDFSREDPCDVADRLWDLAC